MLTTYDRSPHVAATLRDLAEAEAELKLPEDSARHKHLLSSLFPHSPETERVLTDAPLTATTPANTTTTPALAPAAGNVTTTPLTAPPKTAQNPIAPAPLAPLSSPPTAPTAPTPPTAPSLAKPPVSSLDLPPPTAPGPAALLRSQTSRTETADIGADRSHEGPIGHIDGVPPGPSAPARTSGRVKAPPKLPANLDAEDSADEP